MNKINLSEQDRELAAARSLGYSALLVLFQAPLDEQALMLVQDAIVQQAWKCFVPAEIVDGAVVLLPDQESFDTETAGQLEGEYNRAFVGPLQLVAPPYESVYLYDDRSIFRESTLEVRRCYVEAGFVMRQKNVEPDDCLGAELEFLANLWREVAEGDGEKALLALERATYFEQTHLRCWCGPFVEALTTPKTCPHYAALGRLLNSFVKTSQYWQ